jgi:pyrroline-5-carboxylate reductase
MSDFPKIALLGGGNMASALVAGFLKQGCPPDSLHVVEITEALRDQWQLRGASVSASPDGSLASCGVWIYAVKPQQMKEVVALTLPFLQADTLAISIAAGISLQSLSLWLGSNGKPFERVVRCMPNTPALVGAGVTGLAALPGLSEPERKLAGQLLAAVGQTVWVEGDAAIDAVTALSGSGPAYVFLFLEALQAGGEKLGLSAEQSKALALATLSGATELAAASPETPAILRERVTSKGGTTAAALDVFEQRGFVDIVQAAMTAADRRAAELSAEFGN